MPSALAAPASATSPRVTALPSARALWRSARSAADVSLTQGAEVGAASSRAAGLSHARRCTSINRLTAVHVPAPEASRRVCSAAKTQRAKQKPERAVCLPASIALGFLHPAQLRLTGRRGTCLESLFPSPCTGPRYTLPSVSDVWMRATGCGRLTETLLQRDQQSQPKHPQQCYHSN
jgi:hypothetical protein